MVVNYPLRAFKKTIDFVIQETAMKHPNVVKNAFVRT